MKDTEKRSGMNLFGVCTCFLLGLYLVSCSTSPNKVDWIAQQKGQHNQQVDTCDPITVGNAFFVALAKKDIGAVLKEILPEQRPSAKKELEEGFPLIPSEFQLEIESITEKEKAQVQMVDQEFGLDLKYRESRWWVIE